MSQCDCFVPKKATRFQVPPFSALRHTEDRVAAVHAHEYTVTADPDDPAQQSSGFTSSGWDKRLGPSDSGTGGSDVRFRGCGCGWRMCRLDSDLCWKSGSAACDLEVLLKSRFIQRVSA